MNKEQKSYRQILESSALIGGASIISIVLRALRAKAIALLLGPAGVGLLGLYENIIELALRVAGLGLNSSGIRQIAQAVGSGDAEQVARTATTIRRVAMYSGAAGSLLLLLGSKFLSQATFGTDRYTPAICALALVVFLSNISAAQAALVQGLRRIFDLSKMNVLGALYGTIFSIPIVYFMGERGLVPSLVCVGAMSIVTSSWYARKAQVKSVVMSYREVFANSTAMLKLGLVFMACGFMIVGSSYVVRIILVRCQGVDAAGFYQAAWALGGLYVSVILQSMGADFYPRLTAVADDHPKCNQLVNEQAEVGLLLAAPGVLGTLVLSPFVIDLFYSAKFGPAVELLRWFCLGMLLRVASWPMGFVLLAKGAGSAFFWSELLSNLTQIGLVWVGVKVLGIEGAGVGFFSMYVLYWFGIYAVVRRLSGFRWSAANRQWFMRFVPLIALVFLSWYLLPRTAAEVLGVLATACTGVYSLRRLWPLLPLDRFPWGKQTLLKLLKKSSPSASSAARPKTDSAASVAVGAEQS